MMNYEIATHLSGARNDNSLLSLRGTPVPKQSLGGSKRISEKIQKIGGKPLTRGGVMIYSIRQLKGRRRVCKVPVLEQIVRIRQFGGGVYPRPILGSSS